MVWKRISVFDTGKGREKGKRTPADLQKRRYGAAKRNGTTIKSAVFCVIIINTL
jgi:hypothetical protein